MEKSSSITTFEQHLEKRYRQVGEEKRMAFEAKAKAFTMGASLRQLTDGLVKPVSKPQTCPEFHSGLPLVRDKL
jgi:hypothetical protein